MSEVKKLLQEKRKIISTPTTIQDLKMEINILKNEVLSLKEKNIIMDHRISKLKNHKELSNSSNSIQEEENEYLIQQEENEGFLRTLKFNKNDERVEFLQTLKPITSQKILYKS